MPVRSSTATKKPPVSWRCGYIRRLHFNSSFQHIPTPPKCNWNAHHLGKLSASTSSGGQCPLVIFALPTSPSDEVCMKVSYVSYEVLSERSVGRQEVRPGRRWREGSLEETSTRWKSGSY